MPSVTRGFLRSCAPGGVILALTLTLGNPNLGSTIPAFVALPPMATRYHHQCCPLLPLTLTAAPASDSGVVSRNVAPTPSATMWRSLLAFPSEKNFLPAGLFFSFFLTELVATRVGASARRDMIGWDVRVPQPYSPMELSGQPP